MLRQMRESIFGFYLVPSRVVRAEIPLLTRATNLVGPINARMPTRSYGVDLISVLRDQFFDLFQRLSDQPLGIRACFGNDA